MYPFLIIILFLKINHYSDAILDAILDFQRTRSLNFGTPHFYVLVHYSEQLCKISQYRPSSKHFYPNWLCYQGKRIFETWRRIKTGNIYDILVQRLLDLSLKDIIMILVNWNGIVYASLINDSIVKLYLISAIFLHDVHSEI